MNFMAILSIIVVGKRPNLRQQKLQQIIYHFYSYKNSMEKDENNLLMY